MTDGHLDIELSGDGMVINGTITDPDIIEYVRKADDPEEALRLVLLRGARALHGNYGVGEKMGDKR